jgi:predicted anti-sigma-YlaC factor YlaD
MPCTEFEDLLAAYADLTTAERQRADAHLRACPDCRNWFEALAEIGAALGASFEDIHAPATLATHVRRQIVDHQPARVSPVPEILDFVGWLGVIGAAGLLAYFLIPAGYTLTLTLPVLYVILGGLLGLTLSVTVWALRGSES